MAGIGAAFTTPDASVEERLSQFEDVLLQADIGMLVDFSYFVPCVGSLLLFFLFIDMIGVTTTAGIIEDLRAYSRYVNRINSKLGDRCCHLTQNLMINRTEGLKEQDILPVLRERLVQALTSSQPANIGYIFCTH